MELVLVRDGRFAFGDLASMPADKVVDYFCLLQMDNDRRKEDEEQWLAKTETQRR